MNKVKAAAMQLLRGAAGIWAFGKENSLGTVRPQRSTIDEISAKPQNGAFEGPATLRSPYPATVLLLEGNDVDACVAYPHLKENKRRAGR